MRVSLVVCLLLGIAARVSQVSAVSCSSNSNCVATDFTLATCETNVCKCITGYVAVDEGCAEKRPTPTVTAPGHNDEIFSRESAELTCEGGDPSIDTYVWYDSTGAVIDGKTGETYSFSGPDTDSSFQCQIASARTELNSDLSEAKNTFALDGNPRTTSAGRYTRSSDARAIITLSSEKVALGETFTVVCSGEPQGSYKTLKAGDEHLLTTVLQDIDQVADPTTKNVTCKFTSFADVVTFAHTTEIAFPALATTVESVSITSDPAITADVAYRTTDPLPTLACVTSPGQQYLPAGLTVNYSWTGTGSSETSATLTIPNTDKAVYSDIKCTANGVESPVFYKITVDDAYFAAPTIVQVPSSPVVGGQVALTCTVAAGVTGVTYTWEMDGAVIAHQVDKTIQFTNLTSVSTVFKCIATKDGYSQPSVEATQAVATDLTKPTISGELEVDKSASLSLVCESDSEIPGMTYEWSKDNVTIVSATSKTFSISTADDSDTGAYICTTKFGDLTAMSDSVDVSLAAAGVTCTTDADCDGRMASLTGVCDMDSNRCECASNYYVFGGECKAAGVNCTTDADCDGSMESLTGVCDMGSNRCECASNYYASGIECKNGVFPMAGSLLVVFAAALISRLF